MVAAAAAAMVEEALAAEAMMAQVEGMTVEMAAAPAVVDEAEVAMEAVEMVVAMVVGPVEEAPEEVAYTMRNHPQAETNVLVAPHMASNHSSTCSH